MLNSKVSSYVHSSYKISWCIYDIEKPVFITFDNRGEVGDFSQRSGWGSQFFIKNSMNFLSFMTIEASWFLESEFSGCLIKAKEVLSSFSLNKRIGYAGSMGAFAALLYRNELSLTDLVLFNPVTTLNNSLAPWENRFKSDEKYFLTDQGNDSVTFPGSANIKIYLLYDPLCREDSLHVKRIKAYFSDCHSIHFYGVGHGTPIYLAKVDLLKELAMCVYSNSMDDFYLKIKSIRFKQIYFNHMLSSPRVASSSWMKKILLVNKAINTHQNLHEKYSDLALAFRNEDINLSRRLMTRALQISPSNSALKKLHLDLGAL